MKKTTKPTKIPTHVFRPPVDEKPGSRCVSCRKGRKNPVHRKLSVAIIEDALGKIAPTTHPLPSGPARYHNFVKDPNFLNGRRQPICNECGNIEGHAVHGRPTYTNMTEAEQVEYTLSRKMQDLINSVGYGFVLRLLRDMLEADFKTAELMQDPQLMHRSGLVHEGICSAIPATYYVDYEWEKARAKK